MITQYKWFLHLGTYRPEIIFPLSMNGLYSSWEALVILEQAVEYLQAVEKMKYVHVPVWNSSGPWEEVTLFFRMCQIYTFKQILELPWGWLIQIHLEFHFQFLVHDFTPPLSLWTKEH